MVRFLLLTVMLAPWSMAAEKPATLAGTVLSEANGRPLSRVSVYLKSYSGETASLSVEADEKGHFAISGIVPGRYVLYAQRDGYLRGTVARAADARLPAVIYLDEGQSLTGVEIPLKRWSVIAGRIRFNDAEPTASALVQVYQDSFARGRRGYRLVASTRTDDRGEYRIAGISPGAYYVAASYNRPVPVDFEERELVDASGHRVPEYRYTTTFYPGAVKLAAAAKLTIRLGEEAEGVDIFLERARVIRIRGRALNGLNGQKLPLPNLTLRRLSSDGRASISSSLNAKPYYDGFEIRGVPEGSYLLTADSVEEGKHLYARLPLMVTDANIDQLELLLQPEREWRGRVSTTDSNLNLRSLRVRLEPRSDVNPMVLSDVDSKGGFTMRVVPGESYDAFVVNGPDELYIKSTRVGNTPVSVEGISGNQASSSASLDLEVGLNSGGLAGRVWSSDLMPASGMTVTAVPDPAEGRPQLYRTSYSDAYGYFQIRGLAPGRYTAFVYADEPPCELFDVEALESCRSKGSSFTVSEGSQSSLVVHLDR